MASTVDEIYKQSTEAESTATDAALPTPLRRRGSSPAPTPDRGTAPRQEDSKKGVASDPTRVGQSSGKSSSSVSPPKQRFCLRMICLLFGTILVILFGLAAVGYYGFLEQKHVAEEPLVNNAVAQEPEQQQPQPQKPSQTEIVRRALACDSLRKDVLDVVAGITHEFGNGATNMDKNFQLAKTVAFGKSSQAMKEFFNLVVQIYVGAGWPSSLSARMRTIIAKPCQDFYRCNASDAFSNPPVPLALDQQFTSEGAVSKTSSRWYQKTLRFGSYVMPFLPYLNTRADVYQSRPPSVVLGPGGADASHRDCFAFRTQTSIALRIMPRVGQASPPVVSHIVIEQPPKYSMERLSAPRSFSVFGFSADNRNARTKLGSFEYKLAAPAAQAFKLQRPAVGAMTLVFDGHGWNDEYTCLYRVRAFEAPPPSCSGGRLSFEPQA